MTFAQECVIPVERERLWDFLMEVPKVASCVPGVESVEAVDAGAYKGGLRVRVGPIRLSLQGTMTVEEQDRSSWRARMRAEANDRRVGGGIRARMNLTLASEEGGTRLRIETDLAILGQAIANPIASRVQRVFGISQFKIDPSISGNNGQPSARVTLQEKIANNLTFTYITDVTQINSQVIRVEFAFTPALSVASLRDYNGNVSVQFFYKFKVQF